MGMFPPKTIRKSAMVDYKEVLLSIEGFFFILHLFYSVKDLLGAEGGGGAFYQLNYLLIFVNS